jgi:Phage integrase, N-terminal SAM-like domain
MPVTVELTRCRDAAGNVVARLGLLLADEHLEILAGRCRPNTVLAVSYDLKVFFTAVGKPPDAVTTADVLAFMTAQRTGGRGRLQLAGQDAAGVSWRTLRRRLSSVSGLYAFLQARGDVAANPVPRGLPTRQERQRPRHCVPLVKVTRTLPVILSPAEIDALTGALQTHQDRAMVAGRPAPLRGPGPAADRPAVRRTAGVHRRGQGRPPAADPSLARVLRRSQRLPRRRASRQRLHRPRVRGAQGPATGTAAVRGGSG